MPSFRLDAEPWIPVVLQDGTQASLGLLDTFRKADVVAGIAGTPVEVVSITRFLLAVAHLAYTPKSLAQWQTLWGKRQSMMARCADYVSSQLDVWDLFHNSYPFGQLSDLGKTENPAHILVYEAARKNNPVHLDHSLGDHPAEVSPEVLARGLISTNAFAGASGGGYRSGPLCTRAVAFVQGKTLSETLLLNTLVQEQDPVTFDWKSYGSVASGKAGMSLPQRYLWTSRSVRLLAEEGGVSRIMLAPGNEMPEEERKNDPMIPLRLDSHGKDYVPLRLEQGRALWRSAHVLLNWKADMRPLAAVNQLHRLTDRGYLPDDTPVSLRVCAVSGDAQGPSTDLWRDETLPFGVSIIAEDRRFAALQRSILSAENKATEVRKRIYAFAFRYLQNGADAKPDKADVARLADELSPDLVEFWSAIAPMGERIACDDFDEVAWVRQIDRASQVAYSKAVDRLSPDARRLRAEHSRAPKEGVAL